MKVPLSHKDMVSMSKETVERIYAMVEGSCLHSYKRYTDPAREWVGSLGKVEGGSDPWKLKKWTKIAVVKHEKVTGSSRKYFCLTVYVVKEPGSYFEIPREHSYKYELEPVN